MTKFWEFTKEFKYAWWYLITAVVCFGSLVSISVFMITDIHGDGVPLSLIALFAGIVSFYAWSIASNSGEGR